MFAKGNFTLEYLKSISKGRHLDPSIMEKTLFAFGLLDALARVETPFIFKGGTSLMFLLKRPMRLSTDIDILVDPELDIEPFIDKASTLFPFERFEEDRRKGVSGIVKKHYQFFITRSSREKKAPFFSMLFSKIVPIPWFYQKKSSAISFKRRENPLTRAFLPLIRFLVTN